MFLASPVTESRRSCRSSGSRGWPPAPPTMPASTRQRRASRSGPIRACRAPSVRPFPRAPSRRVGRRADTTLLSRPAARPALPRRPFAAPTARAPGRRPHGARGLRARRSRTRVSAARVSGCAPAEAATGPPRAAARPTDTANGSRRRRRRGSGPDGGRGRTGARRRLGTHVRPATVSHTGSTVASSASRGPSTAGPSGFLFPGGRGAGDRRRPPAWVSTQDVAGASC